DRGRLGTRVPLVARGHDLLGLVRGPAEHHRQARARAAAGRPMRFELSEDQALLRDSARAFFAAEFPLERTRTLGGKDARGCDPPGWRRLAELGYLGLTVPAGAGGLGLGAVELAVVCEEIGRACVPGPYLDVVLAVDLLATAGRQDALVAAV